MLFMNQSSQLFFPRGGFDSPRQTEQNPKRSNHFPQDCHQQLAGGEIVARQDNVDKDHPPKHQQHAARKKQMASLICLAQMTGNILQLNPPPPREQSKRGNRSQTGYFLAGSYFPKNTPF